MQESKKTYKEGDLVKICTNKCNVHLMEMFGHCEFNPDEITADEYIALITAVIGNEQCYSVTIFTGYGECYHIIDDEEIIGPASIDELPEDKRDKAIWKNPINEIMFESELYSDNGLKPNTRRISLAVAAVSNLHPEGTIRVVEMTPSQSFLREAIYKDLDNALAKSKNLSDERRVELEKSKENLMKWYDTLRFEEHYEYHIGVDESNGKVYEEPETISYLMVAVNSAGTKAFVMKDRNDQSLFFDYLGPDFKNIFLEASHFKSECIKSNDMPRRRKYCPLCQKNCKHSTRDGETAGCTYTDKHLDSYTECVRTIIYKEKHKVEIWLQENGWIERHLNFRGTCWVKENFQFIVDCGGIAIRATNNIAHETRIRTKEQLQDVLAPYHLPAWLIDELTKKLKPITKKTEK